MISKSESESKWKLRKEENIRPLTCVFCCFCITCSTCSIPLDDICYLDKDRSLWKCQYAGEGTFNAKDTMMLTPLVGTGFRM